MKPQRGPNHRPPQTKPEPTPSRPVWIEAPEPEPTPVVEVEVIDTEEGSSDGDDQ